ncbi:hypothetical protein [Campylobacter cuniculorum]|uniref:Lipoprotein n=2 Tax=Campylobacter cuniculorum TaxID=374106 RepID=A0A1W6BYG3_9BACT|nr:hypothetical protein [Campylobacter cuniculorum]ARJ57124.1 hypothetical protein CCUN_1541 [Campylobacter cuniculorum DSM 23162 = LMG 24588]QOR04568.1 hypothetical protein A0071_01045 [Campylobacter cuniculorum]
MKKIALPLVAGVALFFNACGSNDMEDTALKNKKYYETHLDEAKAKAKWCFEKLDISYKNINDMNDLVNLMNKSDSLYRKFAYNKSENYKDVSNRIRGIDIHNCLYAGWILKNY